MTNSLINLRASLEKAVELIDESLLLPADEAIHSDNLGLPKGQLDFTHAASLLDKCDNVDEQYQGSKPVIRIIHHFACSGGTLVSRCLSAMPNVFLLSEVHPHSDLQKNKENPQYSPSDLAKLAIYAGVPEQKDLADEIFIASIKAAHLHLNERGGILILRDHTHSDYCIGDSIHNNTVVQLLVEYFSVNSLVTIRNPIDSYLSLVSNGWMHFKPTTFEEYCARLLVFLSNFSNKQTILYEDFVQHPQQLMKQICSGLQIPFDPNFEAVYDVSIVTGDSGRKSDEIEERKRRDMDEKTLLEIRSSKSFKELVNQFPKYILN